MRSKPIMGIYDYKENPLLRDEKDFMKQVVEAGKPVLGICHSAQMLADILGARVYNNRYLEMGWFPVRAAVQEKEIDFLKRMQDEIIVFHWHSQTFDLPDRAVHLFESDGCKNHGFIYGNRVVALQFHPEVNEERIQFLIELFGNRMVDGPFVQKEEKMLGQEKYLDWTEEFMFLILSRLEEMV